MGAGMERILVTGGSGFLGRHVQEAAKGRDISVDVLDVSGEDAWIHDIRVPLPPLHLYDRVIHLAGLLGTHELFDNVEAAIDVNIKGTVNVLNYCKERQIPFTGVTMAHVWKNPYETTKLAGERLADAWGREYGFPVNYYTVYNAYGEYQAVGDNHPQKIIPTFARACFEGRPMPIWGDGQQKLDLIYAGDVANLLLVNPQDGTEGGMGVAVSVLEVAEMVADAAGVTPLIEFLPMRRGEHTPQGLPVASRPIEVSIEIFYHTLERTVEWYRDRPVYP
jgi:UDP-glucose 4-epimerase